MDFKFGTEHEGCEGREEFWTRHSKIVELVGCQKS